MYRFSDITGMIDKAGSAVKFSVHLKCDTEIFFQDEILIMKIVKTVFNAIK